jgi:hypothetical protein
LEINRLGNTVELAKKIRLHALEMTSLGKSSHIGSILSMVDIVAVLYGSVLNIRQADPKWSKRDRFILSKGHAGAGVYAALAESGFFPVSELKNHYQKKIKPLIRDVSLTPYIPPKIFTLTFWSIFFNIGKVLDKPGKEISGWNFFLKFFMDKVVHRKSKSKNSFSEMLCLSLKRC